MKNEKNENSNATKLVGLMNSNIKKIQRDGDEFTSVKTIYNKFDNDTQADVDIIFEALCGFSLGKLIKIVER